MKTTISGSLVLGLALVGGVLVADAESVSQCPSNTTDSVAWLSFSVRRASSYGQDDMAAIVAFLRQPDGDDARMSATKNNLLDRLLDLQNVPPGLGKLLLTLYRDRSLSDRTRDYVLQHFAPYVVRASTAGDKANETLASKMIEELRAAARDIDGATGGTALLGLETLAASGGAVSADQVGQLAVECIAGAGQDTAKRATALQVAAHFGHREAVGAARRDIRGDQPVALRLSALAYLAKLGDSQDLELIRGMAKTDSVALVRSAAERQGRGAGNVSQ